MPLLMREVYDSYDSSWTSIQFQMQFLDSTIRIDLKDKCPKSFLISSNGLGNEVVSIKRAFPHFVGFLLRFFH